MVVEVREKDRTMLQILAEICLAITTYFVGRQFWQCFKRERYLQEFMADQDLLQSFISREMLDNPPPRIALFAQPNQEGYHINLIVISNADKKATRRLVGGFSAALLVVAVASCFIGPGYAMLNGILLILTRQEPICLAAKSSALGHVSGLALILYNWYAKDPSDSEQFFDQPLTLTPLYNAVKNLK
jgi:hypothetical protein